jgi:hypothetical protein
MSDQGQIAMKQNIFVLEWALNTQFLPLSLDGACRCFTSPLLISLLQNITSGWAAGTPTAKILVVKLRRIVVCQVT